jgi:hypothetical protein
MLTDIHKEKKTFLQEGRNKNIGFILISMGIQTLKISSSYLYHMRTSKIKFNITLNENNFPSLF